MVLQGGVDDLPGLALGITLVENFRVFVQLRPQADNLRSLLIFIFLILIFVRENAQFTVEKISFRFDGRIRVETLFVR